MNELFRKFGLLPIIAISLSACSEVDPEGSFFGSIFGNVAVISGTPSFDRDNGPSLVVSVTTDNNIISYRVKSGLAVSTDCSVVAGYVPADPAPGEPVATPISAPTAVDDDFKICVVGEDSDGEWQAYEDATEYLWTRDTNAPSVVSFNRVTATPTSGTSLQYEIVFDEDMDATSFDDLDFTSSPGGADTTVTGVSGGPQVFLVSVDVLTAPNTLGVTTSLSASIAADLAGNVSAGAGSASITHDSEGPTIAITNPSAGYVTTTTQTIVASCEASLPLTVSGDVAGDPIASACTGGSLVLGVTLTGGQGTNTITIDQDDALGNSGSATVNVDLDTVAPAPNVTSHAEFDYVASNSILLSGDCENGLIVNFTGSGVLTDPAPTCTGSSYSESIALTGGEGTKFIDVSQTDAAGNTGNFPRNVIVDTTSPSVTGVYATDAIYEGGQTITIEVHFDEAISLDSGNPSLNLETGPNDYTASYNNLTGSVLYLDYTVDADAYSADLDYFDSGALVGATFSDAAGNPANLSLPDPFPASAPGCLSVTSNAVVIGTRASLQINGGVQYDFANVIENDTPSVETIMIVNSTNTPATVTLDGMALDPPFQFEGGTYPGTGDCLNPIQPGACSITVEFAPTFVSVFSDTIVINYDNGVVGDVASGAIEGTGDPAGAPYSVDPVYPANPNWNDYVKNDGTDLFDANDIACVGGEGGDYFSSCLHSAVLKRVDVTDHFSCVNMSVVEGIAGGVFDWFCDDVSYSHVVFFSAGLKPGKGLRDLIDAAGNWIPNSIDVQLSGASQGMTDSTAWWGNTIAPLPANVYPNVVNLNSAGTIYYHSSDISNWGYNISANKVGIVSLAGAKITRETPASDFGNFVYDSCATLGAGQLAASPNVRTVICSSGTNHLWVEVHIDGADTWVAHSGINLVGVKNSVITNTRAENFQANLNRSGIRLRSSSKNLVMSAIVSNGSGGLELVASNFNNIRELSVSEIFHSTAIGSGIYLGSPASGNHFSKIRIANVNGAGGGASMAVRVTSVNNIFEKMNISNIRGGLNTAGIHISGGGTDNKFAEVLIAGSSHQGIHLSGSGNTFSNMTLANINFEGIRFNSGTPTENLFHNVVVANAADGVVQNAAGGSTNILNNMVIAHVSNPSDGVLNGSGSAGVVNFGGYLQTQNTRSCDTNLSNLDATCTGSVTNVLQGLAGSIVGKLGADDPVNLVPGGSQDNYTNIIGNEHWLDFANPFRAWAKLGTSFPDPTMKGFSATGTMNIMDFRVVGGQTLHYKSGDGTNNNAAFTNLSPCPADLDGSVVMSEAKGGGDTFMTHAIEISYDGFGDDDTLCESGEHCVYAPNKGGYQGEDDFYTNSCTFSDGIITGVQMFAHPISSGS